MIHAFRFSVPGKPQPKQRPRRGKGRTYTPKRTRKYERYVKGIAKAAAQHHGLHAPVKGRCEVTLRIVFPDEKCRDADNVEKSILDACNGVLWVDDVQVRQSTKEVLPSSKKRPRVDVEVVLYESAGSMDDVLEELFGKLDGSSAVVIATEKPDE